MCNGQDPFLSLCDYSLLLADSPAYLLPLIVPGLSQELIPNQKEANRKCPSCGCRLPTTPRFPLGVLHLCFCSARPAPFLPVQCQATFLASLQCEGHLFLIFLAGAYPTIFPDHHCAAQTGGLIHNFALKLVCMYTSPRSLSGCRPAVQPRSTAAACSACSSVSQSQLSACLYAKPLPLQLL